MRTMSFGKLVALLVGILVGSMVITFLVLQAQQKAKPPVTVAKRYPVQVQPNPQNDALAAQLRAQQEAAAAARAALNEQTAALQVQAQAIMQRLDRIAADLTALDQRLRAVEAPGRVEVIRSAPTPPKPTPTERALRQGGHRLSPASGYDVQATVGERAWVQSGKRGASVTIGDVLPGPAGSWEVRAVDPDGVVVTPRRGR